MRSRAPAILLLLTIVLVPLTIRAQDASSSSSVPALPEEPLVVREDREFRRKNFLSQWQAQSSAEADLLRLRAEYERDRAARRARCREDIRRANKTSLSRILLRCFEDDMTSLRTFAQTQRNWIARAAGVTEAIRKPVLSSFDLLDQAIGAILLGIESGVYTDKDDVLEAAKNLTAKYRIPAWDQLIAVRIDRTLSWIAQLVGEIDARFPQATATGSTLLLSTRGCLTNQEQILRPLLAHSVPPSERRTMLTARIPALHACARQIQALPVTGSGGLLQP